MSHEELHQMLQELAAKAKALAADMEARLGRQPDTADFAAAFKIIAQPHLEALELTDIFRRIAAGYMPGMPWLGTFALSVVLSEGEPDRRHLMPSVERYMKEYDLKAKYEQSMAASRAARRRVQ